MLNKSCYLSGFGEFGVWQLLSFHQFQQRIAEQEFVVPIGIIDALHPIEPRCATLLHTLDAR